MTSMYATPGDILSPDDHIDKIKLGSSLGRFKGSELRVVNLHRTAKKTTATVAVFLVGYRTSNQFDIDIQDLKTVSEVKFKAFHTARNLRVV